MENIKLASDQQRISNLVIDILLIYFVYSIVVNLFSLSGGFVYAVLFFVYYFVFEVTLGRTIGKFITKTEVVNLEGNKPTLASLFFRTLFRFIPFEFISFLGAKDPVGWHDDLSNTRVKKI